MALPLLSAGRILPCLPDRKPDIPSIFLRINYWLLLLPMLFSFGGVAQAQTTLTAGDVAIVGYNTSTTDAIQLVLLTNVTAGTSFSITDNGWQSSGSFRTGEGILGYTAPTNLPAGTTLTWANGSGTNPAGFSSNNPTGFALSTTQDALIVFTGSLVSPTLIYALSSGAWDATASDPNTSAEPTATNGGSLTARLTTVALTLNGGTNGYYNGPINTGSKNQLLTAISNAGNWLTNANQIATTNWPTTFTLSDAINSLFAYGSTWKYIDNGADQGTAWQPTGFDDAVWTSGTAPLGYRGATSDNPHPVSTIVSYGSNINAKYTTTYFRRSATITNLSSYSAIQLTVRVDDGAVVYVNNIEVARSNMPTGSVTYTTFASTAAAVDGVTDRLVTLSPSNFVEGANTIAVEVHQNSLNSSDLFWDAQLTGTLSAVTPLSLTASASPTSIVTTGTTTLSATVSGGTGPYSYTFSGPGTISQSTPSANTAAVSGLPVGTQTFTVNARDATSPTNQTVTGTVSVTVTQANRTPTVASVIPNQATTVNQPFSYVIPTGTFADADNDALALTVTGLPAGLTFNASTSAITGTPTAIGVSTVTVTATDPGSLSVNTTFALSVTGVAPGVTLTASNNTGVASNTLTCTNPTLILTASVGTGYTYVFSGPDGTPSGIVSTAGNSATVNAAGTYSVTVTDGATNLTNTASTVIESNTTAPVASLVSSNSLNCAVTSVTLTAGTGMGYTYSFGNGATQIGSTNQATVGSAGSYSVVVTGANGCTATATTNVSSDTALPTATLTNNGPITAAQTSATLTASTGAGYTYAFSEGATPITANQATVTNAGTYSVIVTNGNSCTASASTIVTGNAVAPGQVWSYFDKGVTPTAQGSLTWKDPGFVEPTSGATGWLQGAAPLGYGYPTATTVSFGPDANAKYITTYFRRVFNFTQDQLAQNYRYKVRYRRDDGIAIYINGALRADGGGTQTGIEVRRDNLPTGTLTNTTTATANIGTDETWYEFYLPNGALRPGDNLIAAEVHQSSGTSSDIFFDFELIPESNPNTLTSASLPILSTATTNWKYWDEGVSLDAVNWKAANFDDQYWQQTNTGTRVRMGYGETGDPNTNSAPAPASTNPLRANTYTNYISFGLDNSSKFPTHYFRKKFTVANTADFSNYEFRFMRDDAIVLYINGTEVVRDNIEPAVATTSPVPFPALAETTIDGANETAYSTWRPLSASLVQAGDNIIAVEIHQRGPYGIVSSDLTFNLEVRGTPNTPLAPVASSPANQVALLGLPFSYTVPAFTDPNGDVVTYTATGFSSDFTFNPATRVLSGTAQSVTGSPFTVTVTGTDPGNLSGSAVFTLTVTPPPAPSLVRGPYLQSGSTSQMVLRFRTDVACQGQVRYGASAGNLSNVVNESATGTEHTVTLTGLSGNTQYYYSIGSGGSSPTVLEGTATNYFYTAPAPGTGRPTRIWSLGDFGIGSTRQTAVKNAFKNYVQSIGDPYIDLWIWLGDNAYNSGTDTEFQNYVFSQNTAANPYAYGADRFMKQTPFYATPGNHDYNNGDNNRRLDLNIPYYGVVTNPTNAELGGVASGTESYYSYNHNNIHFVSLDSDRYEGAIGNQRFDNNQPQIAWLRRDLTAAQNDPNVKWIVVYWHQPPYSKGTHDSDTDSQLTQIRNNLLPVLEQYKVDLVMCGHSHVYERSKLLKGHYGVSTTFTEAQNNPTDGSNAKSTGKFDGSANSCYYFKSKNAVSNEGTIYVVNGSGGADGGVVSGQFPHLAMRGGSLNDPGASMYIEVNGNRMDVKTISPTSDAANATGFTLVDQFTIVKEADSFAVPASSTASKSANCECTDADGKTHYTDNGLNKLLTIQKNGQNIGKVGDGTFDLKLTGSGATTIAANAPTNYVSTPGGWAAMNRYFTLTPTTEPAGPVNVSFYYQQADVDAINGPVNPDQTPDQLYAYKMNGVSAANVNPASGHTNVPAAAAYDATGAWIYKPGGTASATDWKNTALGNNTYQAEMTVAKLSGGGGLGGPNPITDNTAPTVATTIPDQTATVGQAFSYALPASTFTDVQTPDNLSLSVNNLPAGLNFTAPATISGTPSLSGVSMVTVTATDPGSLTVSTQFTITVNPAPVVVTSLTLVVSANPATILTTGTTTLSAAVSGGTTPYGYTFSGPGMIVPGGNTASVSGLTAGVQTFTVLVTDNTTPTSQTLSGTVSVTVNQANTAPTVATVIPGQTATVGQAFSYPLPASTFNDPEGQPLTIAVTGLPNGLTYSTSMSAISGTVTTTTGSPFTVTVTATDPGSLSVATTFTLTVAPASILATLSGTTTACAGGSASLNVSLTNGTAPYTVVYSDGSNTVTVPGYVTGSLIIVSPTVSTTYALVSVTDAVGTSAGISGTAIVTVNPTLTASISGVLTACPGTSTLLTALGGSTYRWNTGAVTAGISATAGVYSVTVSSGSCSASTSVTVTETPAPVATLTASGVLTCAQTSVTLTAGGGITYAFSTGATQIGNTNQALVSVAGTYTVVVTGVSGCTASAETTVMGSANTPVAFVNQPLSATTVAIGATAMTTVSVSGTGPVTYQWYKDNFSNAVANQTNATLSLSNVQLSDAGSYSVVVSGPCNSLTSTAFNLTVSPDPLAVTVVANPATLLTSGTTTLSASVSGGLLPYSYRFEGPGTIVANGNSATVSGLTAGVQTFTVVVSDATSPTSQTASATVSVTVGQVNTAPQPTANANQTATVGIAFSYTVNAFTDAETPNSLTYTASINPANGLSFDSATRIISGTPSVSGISAVTVTATDPGSLSVSTSFMLTVNPAPVVVVPNPTGPFSITGVTTVNCATVSAGLRRVTFSPQYAGLTGQPITFSIVNELSPTMAAAPYTLNFYTDNPTVTLKAVQTGTPDEASFTYNWLAACNNGGSVPPTPTNTAPTTTGIANQTATVSQTFSLNVASSFSDAQTPNGLTFAATGLPTGLSFSGGTISGTPSVSGVSAVTVTATDPGSLSVSTSFLLTVNPAPVVVVPNPTGPFAITGVTTVSCATVSAGLRRVSFSPQYTGLTGQSITFSIVNELLPTTAPAPYTLNFYTDNPTVMLKAVQTSTIGEATFNYNWLAACAGNPGARLSAEPMAKLNVLVRDNPVRNLVDVEISGAEGSVLDLTLTDARGRLLNQYRTERAAASEKVRFTISNQTMGILLLQATTPTQSQTVRLLKAE